MASYTKRFLSGSTSGKQILVTGTATGSANTIHTAVSGSSDFDEVYLFADNSSSSDVLLTIEWGGTTDPNEIIEINIPGLGNPATDGLRNIIPGLPMNGGLVIKAFAGTGSVLKISGFVNRITA